MPTSERLTDRWLQRVTTEKVQEDYWDSSRPGFYIRVSRTGNRSFFFSYYSPVDHRKRSLLLGRYTPESAEGGLTLTEAVTAWKKAVGRVAEGIDPRGKTAELLEAGGLVAVLSGVPGEHHQRLLDLLGDQPLIAGSFGDLARDYLLHHAWVEKRRTRDDEQMLKRDLLPAWRDRPAAEITRKHVVNLLDELIARRGARVAANHVRLLVSRIYNFGICAATISPVHRRQLLLCNLGTLYRQQELPSEEPQSRVFRRGGAWESGQRCTSEEADGGDEQAWTDRPGRAAVGPAPEYGAPVCGGGPAAFAAEAASKLADAGRPVYRGLAGDRAASLGSAGVGGADAV